MFAGHFGAGLIVKRIEPRAPMLGLMIAVVLLDLVFSLSVGLGLEGGEYSHFDTPWSHSLLMAAVWSLLYAGLFHRWGRPVMVAMLVAVASHWVLDLVSHAPDMQLWPHSSIQLGYGGLFGGQGGWLEAAVSVTGVVAYAGHPAPLRGRPTVIAGVIAVCYGLEVLFVR